MGSKHKWGWAALAAGMTAGLVFLSGCGTPGAPMPPSLHLPDRVTDLAASRTGNRVSLTWTMPKKDTDKLLLESDVQVRVCRKEGSGPCDAAGGGLQLEPGAEGAFTETLPPALANGAPRLLTYFVELNNRNGRSAGESNAGVVLAGEAPAAVGGLAATVRKDGVVLRWTPNSAAAGQAGRTAVRLHRKLLTPEADSRPKAQESLLAPPPEPVEQSLLVDSDPEAGRAPDRALDKGIRFGQSYEYRAQRVIRVTVDGRMLELAGPLSDAVRVVWPGMQSIAARGKAAGSVFRPRSRLSARPFATHRCRRATRTATP
jgi:hypothetical protein